MEPRVWEKSCEVMKERAGPANHGSTETTTSKSCHNSRGGVLLDNIWTNQLASCIHSASAPHPQTPPTTRASLSSRRRLAGRPMALQTNSSHTQQCPLSAWNSRSGFFLFLVCWHLNSFCLEFNQLFFTSDLCVFKPIRKKMVQQQPDKDVRSRSMQRSPTPGKSNDCTW